MTTNKTKETIKKRQKQQMALLLENLERIPIAQIACDKAGINRTTYYRWRDKDPKFQEAADEAIKKGDDLINDMSVSQLISLVKDKHLPAITFWLRRRHPKFKDRNAVMDDEDGKILFTIANY